MVMTMTPAVFATEESEDSSDLTLEQTYVAQIGAETYDSLQNAVDQAVNGTEKITIKLIKDVELTEPVKVPAGNITIDGNGHKISFPGGPAFSNTDDMNLAGILSGTTLTVNNVHFISTTEGQGYAVLINHDVKDTVVTLSGCTFKNLYCAVYANQVVTEGHGAEVNITGCTYNGTAYGYGLSEVTDGNIVNGTKVYFDGSNSSLDEDFVAKEPMSADVNLTVNGLTKAYATLDAAVNAAGQNEAVITLNDDITLNAAVQLASDQNITINGNGHTISFLVDNAGGSGIYIPNSAQNVNLNVDGVNFEATGADTPPTTGFGILVGEATDDVSINVTDSSFANLWSGVYFGHLEGEATGSVTITTSSYENTLYGYSIDTVTEGSAENAVTTKFEDNTGSVVESESWGGNITVTNDEEIKTCNSWEEAYNAAGDGAVIDLNGQYIQGNLKIEKNITLKNGQVDTVTAIGDLNGLTFCDLIFRNVSDDVSGDTNPAALYLQGPNEENIMTDVLVENCEFVGPSSREMTVAITTLNVGGLTVKDSTIDGYIISAYHNPGKGGDITYQGNTFKNIQSGIGFIATDGITVTGNTFENANGIRLEPSWSNDGGTCTDITISENKFLSVSSDGKYGSYAVRVQNSDEIAGVAENETVSLNRNYWGSANPDFDELILAPEGVTVDYDVYYINEAMTKLNTDSTGGSSGGGGGGSVTAYAITVEDSENGQVEANRTSASRGSSVTLTVTPDEGYELSSLTVTDADGNEIEVTENDGTYRFTMPSSKVTVTAEFAESSENPGTPEEPGTTGLPFTDVVSTDWYYDAVAYAYENDLMNGISSTQFNPNGTTTRGMIATILYRLEGEPEAPACDFTDVAAGKYYTDAVAWAVENHLVNGYGDGTFGPNDNITREQMSALLYRYAEFKGYDLTARGDLSGYTDASQISDYAVTAMQWATAEGLVNGMGDGTLAPRGNSTRAQIATILMRFLENIA